MAELPETILFDDIADAAERRAELEALIDRRADCGLIFQWFCGYSWPHASQKALFQLLEENGAGSFEAVKRKFHRWKQKSPEAKRKALLPGLKKPYVSKALAQLLFSCYEDDSYSDFSEFPFFPCVQQLAQLLSPYYEDESYSDFSEFPFSQRIQKLVQLLSLCYENESYSGSSEFPFFQRVQEKVSEIAKQAREELIAYMSYTLTRRNTEAHGILPFAAAKGGIARGCFEVFKGARFPKSVVPSCEKHAARILKVREQLLQQGLLQDDGDFWILKENHIFISPSMAASVLAGVNLSGKTAWKDEYGITLGKYYEKNPLKIKRGPGRPPKGSRTSS